MSNGWSWRHFMAAAVVLTTATTTPVAGRGNFADRVLFHGTVLTVDAHDSIAQAVAVRDGRIIAVGTDEEILALAGPDTEQIDLNGLTATPGLLDSHAHFAQGGLLLRVEPSHV